MPSITQYREAYKINGTFEFPYFFEQYQKALGSVWRPEEVPLESDIRDWQSASQDEREIVGGILKGFTILETHIGEYWSKIPDWFPKHEIAAAARMFSLSEVVHAHAYNLLSDTLGLDEFEAFLGDPVAQKKIGFFLENRNIKESLAIFSGAGEGVSLFSSFSVLLSLNLQGKYRGLSQLISWSINDEQQHSDTGIELFKALIEEDPLTREEAENIFKGFEAVIENEFSFIEAIFKGRHLDTIDPENLKHYILFRANNRLQALGLEQRFEFNKEKASVIRKWFEPIAAGATNNDFFSQSKSGDSYVAKPLQDYSKVNLKTLDLELT
jgi:ribonucleoside-diphosphate reductase beta chain